MTPLPVPTETVWTVSGAGCLAGAGFWQVIVFSEVSSGWHFCFPDMAMSLFPAPDPESGLGKA